MIGLEKGEATLCQHNAAVGLGQMQMATHIVSLGTSPHGRIINDNFRVCMFNADILPRSKFNLFQGESKAHLKTVKSCRVSNHVFFSVLQNQIMLFKSQDCAFSL